VPAGFTAHGTLYKALGRMEDAGLLESHWEDPDVAVAEGRPRRRLYRVTPLGANAFARAQAAEPTPQLRPGSGDVMTVRHHQGNDRPLGRGAALACWWSERYTRGSLPTSVTGASPRSPPTWASTRR